MIIVYITDNIDNKVTALYLNAGWVEGLSQGFGVGGFGLTDFGF